MNKPPLGLRPKWIAQTQRLQEVNEAIARYYDADKEIPLEWVEERNQLIKTIPEEAERFKHKLSINI